MAPRAGADSMDSKTPTCCGQTNAKIGHIRHIFTAPPDFLKSSTAAHCTRTATWRWKRRSHMPRSRSARAVKKCGAITRKGAAFHTVFPDLSDCGRNSIRAQSATASRARRQSRPPDGRQKLRRANGPFTPAQKSPAAPTTASTRLRAAPCPASPKLSRFQV